MEKAPKGTATRKKKTQEQEQKILNKRQKGHPRIATRGKSKNLLNRLSALPQPQVVGAAATKTDLLALPQVAGTVSTAADPKGTLSALLQLPPKPKPKQKQNI